MKSLANMPHGGTLIPNFLSSEESQHGVMAVPKISVTKMSALYPVIIKHFNLEDIYFILSKRITYFSGVKN